MGEREQAQPLATLEELLAERIASEAVRIAEQRIREIVSLEILDPDEVYGFMGSEEAVEFLGLPYSSFREIAPLPAQARHHAGALRLPATRAVGLGSGTISGALL